MPVGLTTRRTVIAALGGAAAWPMVALAQRAAMPVVGVLDAGSAEGDADLIASFRQGVSEAGYIEDQNVLIEYRWAEGKYDRLPSLAAELIQNQSAVVFAPGLPAALAMKAATATIPIVFVSGPDPVRSGLVTSLNGPNGNMTGVTLFTSVLATKRLELLRELVPAAALIAFVVNPDDPRTKSDIEDVEAGARTLGQHIIILQATADVDFGSLFATATQRGVRALLVGNDPFLNSQAQQLVALAARHALPAIYGLRKYAEVGGLMSYSTSLAESARRAGIYVGRILKGEKPADLPVVQPTKFELIINLKTATALGLTVPATLLAQADEVIE
ncbi:MAG: ABC transporter substrate-binding protein [Deltaproteobacteria bacterium]|nr:ABC transporter substrate-binding protein [Deltaproteobacteria bacterium]